ncbi:hypothetical protein AMAG_08968 [Allomyces macrogynus ATCC 38327]|uniref:Transmembrane protein 186 n=1 Tax=Allomyces macrogynus (strain ATCC 38327) TaxID=578462 RepID=A0A0L0SN38_ALLM3|nr:hypothetical protein AMAG_08968 [Allomyces macrogynus ATCC 38327]|eukprot:KNE63907.1 hypothetical protein AMAG_08968 [Allomyces macrogynus ATCC 38327]
MFTTRFTTTTIRAATTCPHLLQCSRAARSRSLHTTKVLPPNAEIVYRGHMNNAVKVLKFFSVSSLGLSAVALPVSLMLVDAATVQANAAVALMLSPGVTIGATVFSTLSTLAAYKFFTPYVTRIFLVRDAAPSATTSTPFTATPDTTVAIETLDLLNRPRYTTAALRELQFSPKPTMTWEARGEVPKGEISQFMIMLRKSGMSSEMRDVLSYMSQRFRAMTMSELTQRAMARRSGGAASAARAVPPAKESE